MALAVADRVLIMENALYFVITPEACAAIMWRDAANKERAAEAMKITAQEVERLGCVDAVISEPVVGAHDDPEGAAALMDRAVHGHLEELLKMPVTARLEERRRKFRGIAQFYSEV